MAHKLKWTKDSPKAQGWYWYQAGVDEAPGVVCVDYVSDDYDGYFVALMFNGIIAVEDLRGAWSSLPVPCPIDASGAETTITDSVDGIFLPNGTEIRAYLDDYSKQLRVEAALPDGTAHMLLCENTRYAASLAERKMIEPVRASLTSAPTIRMPIVGADEA